MKIAQVAPLYESVPPKYYGGTERVVSYLTEALVKEGHDVTLFASGDSVTKANLYPICHRALRLDKTCIDRHAHHVLMKEKIYQVAEEFDIIHSHVDYHLFSLSRRVKTPIVTTLHGRLNLDDLVPLYQEFKEVSLVSISNSQREPLPWVNWVSTVYHGIPKERFEFREEKGKYLAFLGRICPEKRVDYAIEIATRVGMELKIAAKVDKVDEEYFDTLIKPLLNNPYVDYIGEIGEGEKNEFLGNAYALVFPIDWPEPFGLVMIEAIACGTPVIARCRGSVPEVLEHGKTGFIVQGQEDAIAAVEHVEKLSRRQCRDIFEERFTSERMARDYLKVYKDLIQKKQL